MRWIQIPSRLRVSEVHQPSARQQKSGAGYRSSGPTPPTQGTGLGPRAG
jgi:hypothetical protein